MTKTLRKMILVLALIFPNSVFAVTEGDRIFLRYKCDKERVETRQYIGLSIVLSIQLPTTFKFKINKYVDDYSRRIVPLGSETFQVIDTITSYNNSPPSQEVNDFPPHEVKIRSNGKMIDSKDPFYFDFQVYPRKPVQAFSGMVWPISLDFGSRWRRGAYATFLGDVIKSKNNQNLEEVYAGYDFLFKDNGYFGRTILSYRLLSFEDFFPIEGANFVTKNVSNMAGLFSYLETGVEFYLDLRKKNYK